MAAGVSGCTPGILVLLGKVRFAPNKVTRTQRVYHNAGKLDAAGRWNDGRPFFLCGHSQGSVMLRFLLNDMFNLEKNSGATELRARLVGAYLPGIALTTMDGCGIPLSSGPGQVRMPCISVGAMRTGGPISTPARIMACPASRTCAGGHGRGLDDQHGRCDDEGHTDRQGLSYARWGIRLQSDIMATHRTRRHRCVAIRSR